MATLYMVPSVISEEQVGTIPASSLEIIRTLKFYVAERARTARRFLKLCDLPFSIQEIEIIEIEEDMQYVEKDLMKWLDDGQNVGVISESGMPGIADPGRSLSMLAHRKNHLVVPLVGPSSIFLALAASGLNGQSFTFHGYLPIKDHPLQQKLSTLNKSIRSGQAQIFIETPYRNQKLFESLLKQVDNDTYLCLAMDISGKEEKVATKTIKDWKKSPIKIGKIPCVFILGN